MKSTLLVASVLLSSSTFAQELLCSDNFPERPEICPLIYSPVCANYPIACFTEPCPQVQEFGNDCSACSDPLVISYTPGPCEDTETANEEAWLEEEAILEEEFAFEDEYLSVSCTDPRPDICTADYNPVCVTECLDGPCRYTAGNDCSACGDSNVLAYTPQSCEVERVQCPDIDLSAVHINCIDLWEPVCAYSRDSADTAGATVSNSCYACYLNGADYYIAGECPGAVTDVETVV